MAAALGALGLAALALVGWFSGLDLLCRWYPTWPVMPPATALGTVLAAYSLRLRALEVEAAAAVVPQEAIWGFLGATAAVGAWGIAETLLGLHATGMSLLSSAALLGAATALALDRTPWGVRAGQAVGLAVFFAALVSLDGFILDGGRLQAVPLFRDVALPSVLAFGALSVGLVVRRPDVGVMRVLSASTIGGRLLRRLIFPVILVPMAVTALEQAAERHRILPLGFAWLLESVITIYLLGTIVWLVGRSMHRSDLERAEAEQRLRESEERYRTLIETSPDAIVVKSRDCIEYVNQVAVRLVGAGDARELIGHSALQYLHPASRAQLDPLLCSLLASGHAIDPVQQKIVRRDGVVVDIEVAAAAVDYQGRRVAQMVVRDLTTRNRAEAEARQLRQQLEMLVSAAPVVLYSRQTHGDFACLYISPNVERILGYTPREFLSYPSFWAENVHPDDAPRLLAELKKACEQDAASAHVYRLRNRHGVYRWVRDEFQVVRGEDRQPASIVGFWQDITESRRAAAALRRSEDLYRTTFDSAAVGVVHARPSDRAIVRANPTFAALLGYSQEELRKMTVPEITHAADREVDAAEVNRLLGGSIPSYHRDKRYLRRDGSSVWVTVTVSLARDERGEPEHIIVVCHDISARLEVESQLRQSQKMEAVGQLAGGVAHDFNNMLTAILGHSQLLGMAAEMPAQYRDSLQQIEQAAKRAAGLTRQLLLFSRREVMQPAPLDLNEAMVNVGKMLGRLLGERVTLAVEPHAAPVVVHADRGMIEQVVINLAVNARDAMLPEGGTLRVSITTEFVSERDAIEGAGGTYARMSMTDTGAGIAPEVLPHIFEPFFTTKPAGKGTGLGLATVFGIVKQHRGWVRVESSVGHGATFHVYLPTLDGDVRPQPPSALELPRGFGQTILLAEDDPSVRDITRSILAGFGYRVIAVEDGEAAYKAWRESRASIGLVITDVIVPGVISGTELAARVQKESPGLPVLLISGYNPEAAGRTLELPRGQAFLAKPFTADELARRIAWLLSRAGSATGR